MKTNALDPRIIRAAKMFAAAVDKIIPADCESMHLGRYYSASRRKVEWDLALHIRSDGLRVVMPKTGRTHV